MEYTALLIGLFGSLHCLAMCGPIAFMLPLDHKNTGRKSWQIFLYQSGRLLAYAMLGTAFGALGKAFSIFGFQQWLSIVLGVTLILLVLIPNGRLNQLGWSKWIYSYINMIKNKFVKTLNKDSNQSFLIIGLLNGFLPCGLVYIALMGAVALGTGMQGAMYMLWFGLGTLPLMVTTAYLGGRFKPAFFTKMKKALPFFIVLVGVLFVIRGMGLDIPYLSPEDYTQVTSAAEIDCHVP